MDQGQLKYLKTLSRQFPTVALAATEIINLNAILALPKPTEHFITDLHGEYTQFLHVMNNGSGAIRREIEKEYSKSLRNEEKKEIAALIYYPREKLDEIKKKETDIEEWYRITIHRLITICRSAASKYTRSKVRKAMEPEFAYIIEELLTIRSDELNQEDYYNEIISSVIITKRADELIVDLSELIRKLVVDQLHVVGDIYDRGPYPHLIMDHLSEHKFVDIEWGNHDVLWMGAAAGNKACMANVIRIASKYGNLSTIEDGYGINLVPLATFAIDTYGNDPCECFKVNYLENDYESADEKVDERIHKAITVIQFKLEGQIIKRNPEYEMEDRLLLSAINPKTGMIRINGKEYKMLDMNFPTIDWDDPYKLSDAEKEVVERLTLAFKNSEKLQKHIRYLYSKGSMYKVYNGNLLYHGCVPLNEDGSFRKVSIFGKKYAGRALFEELEEWARKGYFSVEPDDKQKGEDLLLYIWENPNSPVFGKDHMATFERYFIAEKETHVENKNPYYSLYDDEEIIDKILKEFGLMGPDSRIVNGHVPVEVKKGESPIKCGGKLLIIDGGFSKAYQTKTGIAGYTLIYSSHGMMLAQHEPFTSVEEAVKEGTDIYSQMINVQQLNERLKVSDTDIGASIREQLEDLQQLLDAYRDGAIKEN